jgi:hypothetical protein
VHLFETRCPSKIIFSKKLAARLSRPVINPKMAALALAVALVVVTGGFSYVYLQSQSSLAQKDASIANLEASLALAKLNVTEVQLESLGLNLSIANLQQQILGLKINQTASEFRIISLKAQLATLRNQSALTSLELGIVYHIATISVSQFSVNATISVPPGTSTQISSGTARANWTLAFLSPKGCPLAGIQVVKQPEAIAILLNSTDPPITSEYMSFGPQAFSISFENVGPATVQCTYSAFSVYGA